MKSRTIKYTDHVLERMGQRQINKALVQECVDKGECKFLNNSYHYTYNDLTVVLNKNNVTVMTTYKNTESESIRA